MLGTLEKLVLLFTTIVSLVCTTASASTLVARDWQSAGDNALTYDSSTNLEWLDLTQTVGESVVYVDSQLGPGGAYDGFRYATRTEVEQLFNDFGIFSAPNDDAKVIKIDELAALMGQTYPANPSVTPAGGSRGFAGINDPALYNRDMWLMNMWYQQQSCCGGATWWEFQDFGYDPSLTPATYITDGASDTGSYLVRTAVSTVPLPATAWLFGSGLLGLAGMARSKKGVLPLD